MTDAEIIARLRKLGIFNPGQTEMFFMTENDKDFEIVKIIREFLLESGGTVDKRIVPTGLKMEK